MSDDLPTDLPSLLDWIERYADDIYVRERNADGHWEAMALSALPTKVAIKWVCSWIREGRVPSRVKS